jgi:hypothetical protein
MLTLMFDGMHQSSAEISVVPLGHVSRPYICRRYISKIQVVSLVVFLGIILPVGP